MFNDSLIGVTSSIDGNNISISSSKSSIPPNSSIKFFASLSTSCIVVSSVTGLILTASTFSVIVAVSDNTGSS